MTPLLINCRYDEDMCPSNGSVSVGTEIKRHEDWKTVNTSTLWITEKAAAQKAAAEVCNRAIHNETYLLYIFY